MDEIKVGKNKYKTGTKRQTKRRNIKMKKDRKTENQCEIEEIQQTCVMNAEKENREIESECLDKFVAHCDVLDSDREKNRKATCSLEEKNSLENCICRKSQCNLKKNYPISCICYPYKPLFKKTNNNKLIDRNQISSNECSCQLFLVKHCYPDAMNSVKSLEYSKPLTCQIRPINQTLSLKEAVLNLSKNSKSPLKNRKSVIEMDFPEKEELKIVEDVFSFTINNSSLKQSSENELSSKGSTEFIANFYEKGCCHGMNTLKQPDYTFLIHFLISFVLLFFIFKKGKENFNRLCNSKKDYKKDKDYMDTLSDEYYNRKYDKIYDTNHYEDQLFSALYNDHAKIICDACYEDIGTKYNERYDKFNRNVRHRFPHRNTNPYASRKVYTNRFDKYRNYRYYDYDNNDYYYYSNSYPPPHYNMYRNTNRQFNKRRHNMNMHSYRNTNYAKQGSKHKCLRRTIGINTNLTNNSNPNFDRTDLSYNQINNDATSGFAFSRTFLNSNLNSSTNGNLHTNRNKDASTNTNIISPTPIFTNNSVIDQMNQTTSTQGSVDNSTNIATDTNRSKRSLFRFGFNSPSSSNSSSNRNITLTSKSDLNVNPNTRSSSFLSRPMCTTTNVSFGNKGILTSSTRGELSNITNRVLRNTNTDTKQSILNKIPVSTSTLFR